MPKYVVVNQSVQHSGKKLVAGDEIELTAEERKRCDPEGHYLEEVVAKSALAKPVDPKHKKDA